MLVSISLGDEAGVGVAARISLPDDKSFTRAAPSAPQKANLSSDSTRLHLGHRFIVQLVQAISLP